ncbi:neuronal acetylcholine receptor subunit alpha-10-like isoform X2 [Ptychodera flava]|uniref:neuronal acetylcholine receptor subunit alpha-10-like isoform X2 n=1 Tax=Ptychodera flava TaxID=63121 RepID=UPI00396A99BF
MAIAVIKGILLCLMFTGLFASPDEFNLLHDVLANYSNIVRPVSNSSAAVLVKYGAALQQIIDLDEKNQVLTSNLWIRMQWSDDSFKWNPDDYGGTSVLIVPSDTIWKPDIVLYNNADESFSGMMNTNAQIYSDGTITWFAPAIYKSTCKIDVTYFPFDLQRCTLKFGSWAYNGFQIDLTNRSTAGDIGNYLDNGEWQLEGMPVKRNVLYYGCCPEPYPDVTFTIIIQRRALFYLFNLLVPCMLISTITLLDFYLPADAGEKVTLGITILLALTVFLLLVAETMPPTSEVAPLIGQYYLATICLVSISTSLTVIVLSLHYKVPGSIKPVPRWARIFFLHYCARILCLGDLINDVQDTECTVVENNHLKNTPQEMREHNSKIINKGTNVGYSRFDFNIMKILKNVESMTQRYKDQDKEDAVMNEWKLVALVVDRIFLWMFLIATVGCTAGILSQAPKIV